LVGAFSQRQSSPTSVFVADDTATGTGRKLLLQQAGRDVLLTGCEASGVGLKVEVAELEQCVSEVSRGLPDALGFVLSIVLASAFGCLVCSTASWCRAVVPILADVRARREHFHTG
jgi:hypothetical protein